MRACGYCGASLEGRHRKTLFCNENCRRYARYSGTCEDCGARTYNGSVAPPRSCLSCSTKRSHEKARERILDAIRRWADEFGEPPRAMDWNVTRARDLGHNDRAEVYEAGEWASLAAVQRMFGSWANGIEAAGFPRLRPGIYDRSQMRRAA